MRLALVQIKGVGSTLLYIDARSKGVETGPVMDSMGASFGVGGVECEVLICASDVITFQPPFHFLAIVGMKGFVKGRVVFDRVFVPESALLGAPGSGMEVAQASMQVGSTLPTLLE